MIRFLRYIEITVIKALAAVMTLVLLLAFIELVWVLIMDILSPPLFFLAESELLDLFGQFMLVIIGFELLESITRAYLVEKAFRVEVVFVVAMIAMARKVIILDLDHTAPLALIGMGAIIFALAGSWFILKKTGQAGP